ncbi:MAG TPA: TldD/PmbA family protein [Metalysinibacillus sp.]
MERQQFQQALLQTAIAEGLQDAEVYAEFSSAISIKVNEGELDTYETSEEGGVSFRARFNDKMGYAYTEKIEQDSIRFLVDAVKKNADIIEIEDTTTSFAGSERYAKATFYNDNLEAVTPAAMISTLQQVEEQILALDERIKRVSYCQMQLFTGERHLVNAKGLDLHEASNGLIIFANAVAMSNGETKTGSEVEIIDDLTQFTSERFAKRVATQAVAGLGGLSIASAKYPVILENEAATALLNVFTSSFSAEEAQKGMSRLQGKVGKHVAAEQVTITDEPCYKKSLSKTTFDAEGVAAMPRTIIKQGVLQTLLHNRRTAEEAGVSTTGNAYKPSYKGTISIAPHKFVLQPGTVSKDELINGMDKGVLITALAGLHAGANTISGDFSVAASGFYIENGKIIGPTKQMTIASNFFELLTTIELVADDTYAGFARVSSPSLRIAPIAVTIE